MRNPSKNTIKKVLHLAKIDLQKGLYFDKMGGESRYFLTNEIGAAIWRLSKGKICNRAFTMTKRHKKYIN